MKHDVNTGEWSNEWGWGLGHVVLVQFNSFSAGIDFRRPNLTSIDVRFGRLKSIPALIDVRFGRLKSIPALKE